jgi:hypothetical protein
MTKYLFVIINNLEGSVIKVRKKGDGTLLKKIDYVNI